MRNTKLSVIRLVTFSFMFLSVTFWLSENVLAYTDAVKTPLHYVSPRFSGLPAQLQNIAFGLAGLAMLGVGALGIFGKMSWPWVGSIIGSTALISGTFYYMKFIVN